MARPPKPAPVPLRPALPRPLALALALPLGLAVAVALAAAPAARAATTPARPPAAPVATPVVPGGAPAGWLGVTLGTTDLLQPDPPPDEEPSAAPGEPGPEGAVITGAVITGIVKDSPADRAGLRAGDLVVRVGTATIAGPSDVQRAVASAPPGEWSELEILRGAQRRTVTVKIGARDDAQTLELRRAYVGITPVDVPAQLKEAWGGAEDRGVLVGEVAPAGPAARGGLRPGDLVLRVNGHAVGTPGELMQRVQLGGVGNTAEVEISRQGTLFTLAVDLEDVPPSGAPGAPAPPRDGRRGVPRRTDPNRPPGP